MNELICPDCGKSFWGTATFSWHYESVHGVADQLELIEKARQAGPAAGESSHTTVGALALQARIKYGSPDHFADRVVAPELERAGLYVGGLGLTHAGREVRADLETRMAGVLQGMQQRRGPWVTEEPRRALLAAALAVALGQARPPDESDMPINEQPVGTDEAQAVAPLETGSMSDFAYHWVWLDSFDRYFSTMDSEVDSGDSGGDGGDSDDGGDSGSDWGE